MLLWCVLPHAVQVLSLVLTVTALPLRSSTSTWLQQQVALGVVTSTNPAAAISAAELPAATALSALHAAVCDDLSYERQAAIVSSLPAEQQALAKALMQELLTFLLSPLPPQHYPPGAA